MVLRTFFFKTEPQFSFLCKLVCYVCNYYFFSINRTDWLLSSHESSAIWWWSLSRFLSKLACFANNCFVFSLWAIFLLSKESVTLVLCLCIQSKLVCFASNYISGGFSILQTFLCIVFFHPLGWVILFLYYIFVL